MPAEKGDDSKDLFEWKVRMSFSDFEEAIKRATIGACNPLNGEEVEKLFKICDGNNDGVLTNLEIREAEKWFRPLVKPEAALINVDVQNDFISGSLTLPDAEEVVPVINQLINKGKFHLLVYSKDWHPENHISFIDNVRLRPLAPESAIQDPDKIKVHDVVFFKTENYGDVEQIIWPKHCVQNSSGASFHKDLEVPKDSEIVEKGYQPDVESYSAFGSMIPTNLQKLLEENEITELYLTGLALDVCVGNTGLDALRHGYTVIMVEDAQRGVAPKSIRDMKERVEEAGGTYRNSSEVIAGKGITLDDRMATLRRKLSREISATQINT